MTSTDKKCRTCIIMDDVSARLSKADDDVAESKITENRYLKICATSKKLYENLLELCSCDEDEICPCCGAVWTNATRCDCVEICEIEPEPDDDNVEVLCDLIKSRVHNFSENCDSELADSIYENRRNIYMAEYGFAHSRAQDYDLHHVYRATENGIIELHNVYWKVEIGIDAVFGCIYTIGSPDGSGTSVGTTFEAVE